MSKIIDLKNKKFGKLTVISREKNANDGHARWLCKCDCGNTVIVKSNLLRRGISKSCGCYKSEISRNLHTKHNGKNTKLYSIWASMIQRTSNSNLSRYKDYGGRGIKVCDEWREFTIFSEWAYKSGYYENHKKLEITLDRIDVNGNYEPKNCRWINQKQQCRNRRNNILLKYGDETHCLMEWSEILNMSYAALITRYRRGWSDERILATPVRAY